MKELAEMMRGHSLNFPTCSSETLFNNFTQSAAWGSHWSLAFSQAINISTCLKRHWHLSADILKIIVTPCRGQLLTEGCTTGAHPPLGGTVAVPVAAGERMRSVWAPTSHRLYKVQLGVFWTVLFLSDLKAEHVETSKEERDRQGHTSVRPDAALMLTWISPPSLQSSACCQMKRSLSSFTLLTALESLESLEGAIARKHWPPRRRIFQKPRLFGLCPLKLRLFRKADFSYASFL